MKTKLSLIGLVLLFSFNSLNAQKAVAKDLTIEATLNLQVGGAPINFQVSEIRMRYFLTSKLALRSKFAFDFTSGTDHVYNPLDPNALPFTIESNSSNLNLGIGVEHHFIGTDKLSPYFGAEAGFGISNKKTTGTNTYDGLTMSEGGAFIAQTTGAYSAYVGLVFGADYYIVPSVYVGAEISYGFGYQGNGNRQIWNNYNQTTIVNTLGSGMGFGLGANPGVRIGLKF